jgi:hypothetical protein
VILYGKGLEYSSFLMEWAMKGTSTWAFKVEWESWSTNMVKVVHMNGRMGIECQGLRVPKSIKLQSLINPINIRSIDPLSYFSWSL